MSEKGYVIRCDMCSKEDNCPYNNIPEYPCKDFWRERVTIRYVCNQGHEFWLNEETESSCPVCESMMIECVEWDGPE